MCARVAPGQSRNTEHVPVILTLSGGVSLGSYEAGVNWGLIEVFKRTADPTIRKAWHLPRYELKTMAGASAGNINGFLAAIEWCRTDQPTPPEQSLFWKIWVPTGFDQLFPLERYSQEDSTKALFSRRYFDEVLFDTIKAAMRDLPASTGPGGCTIPVGVTITRLTPDTIHISTGLHALTQRYAAVVNVSRQGGVLAFRAPPADLRDNGKLGALILLPDCRGAIDPTDVFSLVEASSAFPGAFAPVSVKYEERLGSGCDRHEQDSTFFSDGGLFDNNPIDLAAGVYDETVSPYPQRADSDAILVFTDPDALRGRFATVRQESHALADSGHVVATGGIAALLDLFAGAVPSARQYEIQAFGRTLARAPTVFVRDNIKVTDRRFPLVGEQLGNFGAFLGKPFREYDFYAGVYDALAFFAAQACPAARQVDSLCLRQRLGALVETPQLDFGGPDSLPRTILRALLAQEYPAAAPPVLPRLDSTASRRTVLLLGLLQANLALADSTFDNRSCASGDAIVALLCHNGFRRMLRRFANDTVLEAIERAEATRLPCKPEDWKRSPVLCEGDRDFGDFVERPESFLADKLGLMLHQLWRVERGRKQAREKAWIGVATINEVVFQSGAAYRYRRGFDLNTSSIPPASGKAWLAALIPNYVSVNLNSQGLELGYRPTVHLSNSFALTLTGAPLHLIQNAASDVDRYRWVIGPALHWKETSPALSGVETGIELFGRWKRDPFGSDAGRVWSIPVTLYLLADKLRISARILPGNRSPVNDGGQFALSVGLADLNGLVYWVFRKS